MCFTVEVVFKETSHIHASLGDAKKGILLGSSCFFYTANCLGSPFTCTAGTMRTHLNNTGQVPASVLNTEKYEEL